MSDLIDRDATIKSICEKECDALKPCQAECESIWAVKEMPSVQPTYETPSNTLDALDCVDRHEAIDAISKKQDAVFERDDEIDTTALYVYSECKAIIKDLPSAQPQKGKWIYGEHESAMCDGYRCDKCGFFVPWDYQHKFIDFIKDYNYCPSCGAKMEVKND